MIAWRRVTRMTTPMRSMLNARTASLLLFLLAMPTPMRSMLNARPASLLLFLLAMPAWGVEHPGVIPVGSECASCHVKKVTGKSVHSAMSTQCTVCHVARTQGDMTTLSLAMPKELICFACHEKSAELQQHVKQINSF